MTTASAPGSSGRSRRRASTSSAAPPCSAPAPSPATPDPIVEIFRAWIEAQHADLQFITSGYIVAIDGVAIRGDDGTVGWYPDLAAAERAAVRAMKADETIFALPWPAERHKAVLDQQLRWVTAAMADARRSRPTPGSHECPRIALRAAIADLVGV